MQPVIQHTWSVNRSEAVRIQQSLKGKIELQAYNHHPETVAAVDVAYARHWEMSYAVMCVFTVIHDTANEVLQLRNERIYTHSDKVRQSYVPGLLSFREIPLLIPLFKGLASPPDLLLTDGAGIAHPRRMGLATHLGILFGIPSIGVAKSRLIGSYPALGAEKGRFAYLQDRSEIVGTVLRSRRNCKPVFVSPGYLTDVESATQIVLKFCHKYRIPEPLRRVDQISREMRKKDQIRR